MVGRKIGGVNVFGGGLALYATTAETLVGAVGVSGDTSCADHNIAWRVRNNLGLDHLANTSGVSGDATRPDNIVFDIAPNINGGTGIGAQGFGHPMCLNNTDNYKTFRWLVSNRDYRIPAALPARRAMNLSSLADTFRAAVGNLAGNRRAGWRPGLHLAPHPPHIRPK
jgi:Haem-degrading